MYSTDVWKELPIKHETLSTPDEDYLNVDAIHLFP